MTSIATPTITDAPRAEIRTDHGRKEQFVFDAETKSYAWKILENNDSNRHSGTMIHYVDRVPTPFDLREKQIEEEDDKMVKQGPYGEYVKYVSIGGKYSVWSLTRSGQIHRLNLRSTPPSWEKLQTGLVGFTDICCGRRDSLFAIGGFDKMLYRLERESGNMTLVDIEDNFNLVQISAISYRKVYGIAENGVIVFLKMHRFRSKKNMWKLIEGPLLKKISAGGRRLFQSELWGIGKDGYTYRYIAAKETWFKINEKLSDVSVAKDCTVYGVLDNNIVQWNGEQFVLFKQLEGKIANLSAYKAHQHVYYVNESSGDVGRVK